MTADAVIAALGLPSDARLDRRVPKKMLAEQGSPTTADRKQLQDGIEEFTWVAALKPANIGVPECRDETREYLEIAVLSVVLRSPARSARLTELIHRAIPYPALLVSAQGEAQQLSLAHKRFAQNEAASTVLDSGVIASPPFSPSATTGSDQIAQSFLQSLSLSAQCRVHLCALYQSWVDRVMAFQAARITGRFTIPATAEAVAARRAALSDYERIEKEIVGVRASRARVTSQSPRRAEHEDSAPRWRAFHGADKALNCQRSVRRKESDSNTE